MSYCLKFGGGEASVASLVMTLEGRVPIARGRIAEIYEWEPGQVLRLEPGGVGRATVEAARDALQSARSAGAPCPEVFDVIEVDSRVGLVMERVDGPDMLQHFTSRPWRLGASARALARLHLDIVATQAPAGSRPLRPDLERQLEHDAVPEPVRSTARGILAQLPDGDRLLHGDFHPGNVLLGKHGAVVVDWENLRAGDPTADHVMTSLLLRYADPPNAPRPLRALIAGVRRRYATAYERAFRREMAVRHVVVNRWRYVLAAARLSEEIEPERARLLRLLRT